MKFDNLILQKLCLIFFSIFLIYRAEAVSIEKINGMTEKEINNFLEKNIDSFTEKDVSSFENFLLQSKNLDIGEIGIKLIGSDNNKLQGTGLELISDVCINKPEFFQPNSFYNAFINSGPVSEPYIVNIIRNTKNDFCREWACELYVKMFCKFYADAEDRHILALLNKKEQEIYLKTNDFFKDPVKVDKLYQTRQSLGNVIRQEWGTDSRYPLRLLSVINLLDNLEKINHQSTIKLIHKIINSEKFDYNLLSGLYTTNQKSPSIPHNLRLRYLAKAIFVNNTADTFQWLPASKGGFTQKELRNAIKNKDEGRIIEMETIFHQFISAVLLRQLINGGGNREINLLKRFYFSTWEKELKWDDRLLTIHNKSNSGVPLILMKKADIEKILTGKGITSNSAEERSQEFYIPSNSKFVWFIPEGNYEIKINLKNIEIKNGNILKFKARKLQIDQNNLTLNIY